MITRKGNIVQRRPKPYNLKNEPEIFPYDKKKKQILDGTNYVENAFLAIGYASRCWTEKKGKGVFDTSSAQRVANELCAYMRLMSEGKIKIREKR